MKSIKPVVPSKAAARAALDTISLTALHEDLQKLYPNIAKENNERFLYSIKALYRFINGLNSGDKMCNFYI